MIKKFLSYTQAEKLLEEGDVLLFEGKSIFSFFITRVGEGKHSHVAIASIHNNNSNSLWECIEFKEWKGGRTINLERYVKNNRIDVYRPNPKDINLLYNKDLGIIEESSVEFDGKKVTNTMRKMTGLPYGWKRILWIAQHKIPFLRLFYSVDSIVDDSTRELVYPVCSTAVAYSYSKAEFDLVPNRNDKWTEPSDIARSALLNYMFTII